MHKQPSFAGPLQLSLLPSSQVSATAGAMLHAPQVALAPQVCLPAAHLPTNPPSEQGRCCPCTQGHASFTTPLQVSSLPGVQVSLLFAWMLHAPQCRSAPHVCVPAAQLP